MGSCLASVLLVTGAGFEAAGFVIAFLDLRDTRRRFAEHLRRAQVIEVGGLELKLGIPSPTVIGGQPPTIGERLDRLETELQRMRQESAKQRDELRAELQRKLQDAVAGVSRAREREDEELRKLVQGVLVKGIPLRRIGVGFFVLGLILATASNFV